MAEQMDYVLRDEVAKEFRCEYPTTIVTAWGEKVDLRKIDIEKARELHQKGLDVLVPIAPAKSPEGEAGTTPQSAEGESSSTPPVKGGKK